MLRPTSTTVARLAAALALALAIIAPASLRAEEPPPFDPYSDMNDTGPSEHDQAVNRLAEGLALLYAEHLKSTDWLTRSMAIIGLAEVRHSAMIPPLLGALENDENSLVKACAFEALYARLRDLEDEQFDRWLAGGRALMRDDVLRGNLRLGLLYGMARQAPTPENIETFLQMFRTTNALNPSDVRTLMAMRGVLGRWREPTIIKTLIQAMSNLNDAYRAELILQGLDSGVAPARDIAPKGSAVMWQETQQAWADWYRRANPQPSGPDPKAFRAAYSRLLERPREIVDPADPHWRQNLELMPLRLRTLDVAFVVDSTGSMGTVIAWLRHSVNRMMNALHIVSREPRIGLVFYRDRGDEYLVRRVPLTERTDRLTQAIDQIEAGGGGDIPEAVYEALHTAINKLRWVSSHRIVITAADAPPHEETLERTENMVKMAAKEGGFYFHFIKARTRWGAATLDVFDHFARLGKGTAHWAEFMMDYEWQDDRGWDDPRSQAPPSRNLRMRVASSDYNKEVDRQVIGAVLQSVLNEDYHRFAPGFAAVLMEYVERYVPEKRFGFSSYTPQPQPVHGPRRQRRETEPVDPQKR